MASLNKIRLTGYVLKNPMIGKGYINTIIILLSGLFINLVMTTLAAYFLSKKNITGRSTRLPRKLRITLNVYGPV